MFFWVDVWNFDPVERKRKLASPKGKLSGATSVRQSSALRQPFYLLEHRADIRAPGGGSDALLGFRIRTPVIHSGLSKRDTIWFLKYCTE
jgi:hypothetical protein